MIRIYDKEEKIFSNLGLGSLDETISAVVIEELNGSYEMEMEYPITGRHFDKLQLKNIIFCKPSMYTREQPFRIYSITKPIDGKVTVNAEHISYDTSGITTLPKRNTETKVIESFGTKVTHNDEEGYFLDTILADIKTMSSCFTKNYFNLIRGSDKENVFKKDGYTIPAPTNLRSMLGGDSGSILEKFKGEYLFDRFDVTLKNKRGVDRGLTIRYGKNMTDIEHESEGNNLFTAIFPFYSKNYTETQQTTKPIFQETYIIEGVTPLRADWLSVELIDVSKGIGGINLKPVIEVIKVIVDGVEDLVERYAPIRVKTPNDPENPSNDFYDKIYVFKRNTEEDCNLIKAYVSQKHVEQITVSDKLKDIEVITELKLNPEDVIALTPVFGKIYVIQSEDSEHYNRKMIWDKGSFSEYSSDGFYVEAKDATLVDTLKDLKPIPTYPISWDEVNSKWIRDEQNGYIYVEPKKPNIGTISVDKYVYVDLLEYELPEESNVLLENGVMYINETLKNLSSQRMLTLDLTGDIDSIDNLEPTDITSQHLFDKAEQYLKDNDLTKPKESITISFIKLSDSPEYEHLKALEIVELGDEINVIYEELGINSKHRVIATHYNVLTDSYDEIELGEKTAKITNNIVTSGDNVSSLKNDAEYTEKTYVVNFVAENANIINADIHKAIIQTLEASNVNISGLLVASHATIDDLVSQMMVMDNAKISELLEAGSVRVRGKITALSGEIGGCKIEDGKLVVSSSINITNDETEETKIDAYIVGSVAFDDKWLSETEGGTPLIPEEGVYYKINTPGEWYDKTFYWFDDIDQYKLYNETKFEVDSLGNVTATSITITGNSINEETKEINKLQITPEGHFECNNVEIKGNVIAESLDVKDFVKFNDLVKLTHTVSTANISQVVSFNASVQFIGDSDNPRKMFMLIVTSNDYYSNSLNVWEDETITIYLKYLRGEIWWIAAISCTIDEGGSSKYPIYYTTDIFTEIGTPQNGDGLVINDFTPNSKLEEKYIDINVLSPDSHFGPEKNNTYDLGSTEKRWRDAFIKEINVNELIYTTLTQSSDRRLKKEINYDMSIFDKFFDTIKPVSYKYLSNNDSKIRLGFIAQDIAESLKLHNLNEDYALYSKKINKDSKHKEITDLSEDDYSYSLSYSELHAIEVRQIQLLKKHVEELEKRIKKLENEKDL